MSTTTYTERKGTTPAGRYRCARHAASELVNWAHPEGAPSDWLPTQAQVIAKTREMYRVTVTQEQAREAIAEVAARRVTAA